MSQHYALKLLAVREGEEIAWDYASLGLTLRRHPLADVVGEPVGPINSWV